MEIDFLEICHQKTIWHHENIITAFREISGYDAQECIP